MQKVHSPAPKTEYSPNWPAWKANASRDGRVPELEPEGAGVDGLVDDSVTVASCGW